MLFSSSQSYRDKRERERESGEESYKLAIAAGFAVQYIFFFYRLKKYIRAIQVYLKEIQKITQAQTQLRINK